MFSAEDFLLAIPQLSEPAQLLHSAEELAIFHCCEVIPHEQEHFFLISPLSAAFL
jgi:hypothetical protein